MIMIECVPRLDILHRHRGCRQNLGWERSFLHEARLCSKAYPLPTESQEGKAGYKSCSQLPAYPSLSNSWKIWSRLHWPTAMPIPIWHGSRPSRGSQKLNGVLMVGCPRAKVQLQGSKGRASLVRWWHVLDTDNVTMCVCLRAFPSRLHGLVYMLSSYGVWVRGYLLNLYKTVSLWRMCLESHCDLWMCPCGIWLQRHWGPTVNLHRGNAATHGIDWLPHLVSTVQLDGPLSASSEVTFLNFVAQGGLGGKEDWPWAR